MKCLNLEYILPEDLLILFPVFLGDNLTKLWEINQPIPGNLIGQVKHLLLQGVQPKHFQSSMQVLNIKVN